MTNSFAIRRDRQSNHWQDWVNVILAIWLFLSPWILQFMSRVSEPAGISPYSMSRASWNAWVLGVIIFLVAISALSRLQLWQEWVNLLLGIWVFISPWVLGFSRAMAPSWDHWVVGVLVFVFAVWDLQTIHRTPLGPPQPTR